VSSVQLSFVQKSFTVTGSKVQSSNQLQKGALESDNLDGSISCLTVTDTYYVALYLGNCDITTSCEK
jgi:hypothetical protein